MESSPEVAVDHAADLGHVRRPGGRAGQRPDRTQPAGVRVVVGVVGESSRLRAAARSGEPPRRLVQQRAGAARLVREHAGGASAPHQRRLHGRDQARAQGHRHNHPLLAAAREGAVGLVHRRHQGNRRPVRRQVRDDASKVGGVLRHAIRAKAATAAAAVRRERRRGGVGESDEVPHAQGRCPPQHVAAGRVGGPVIRAAAAQVSRRKPGSGGDRAAAADVVAVLRQVQAGGCEQQPRDPRPDAIRQAPGVARPPGSADTEPLERRTADGRCRGRPGRSTLAVGDRGRVDQQHRQQRGDREQGRAWRTVSGQQHQGQGTAVPRARHRA